MLDVHYQSNEGSVQQCRELCEKRFFESPSPASTERLLYQIPAPMLIWV